MFTTRRESLNIKVRLTAGLVDSNCSKSNLSSCFVNVAQQSVIRAPTSSVIIIWFSSV